MKHLPLGPLMIDVQGTVLSEEEQERLCHPLVGGVILFSRNYSDRAQLHALTTAIRALRQPELLIAVDHEGGRVQRFRTGFTVLPAMRTLGLLFEADPAAALRMTRAAGFVLAAELRACGVDFSFTPVVDLDYGPSRVIGDRSFHRDPEVVGQLALALTEGLHAAGMANCAKHFPGHGYVIPDSHHELPIDDRTLDEMQADIQPYRAMLQQGGLDSVMAAHVIYAAVAPETAVFSAVWNRYLHDDLGFDGMVFTDDLSMAGAGVVGGMLARVERAYAAGCDMALICNSPDAACEVLANWRPEVTPDLTARIAALRGYAEGLDAAAVLASTEYKHACATLAVV